jgi:type I restriction enzyme S subunit
MKTAMKRTEVGIIPEDWGVFRLADNFNIYAGGDAPKHSLSDTQSETHPYPIFANALQGKGLYGFTGEKRAKADSVTVTARGYVGHAEHRDQPFFPIVRLLVLEPNGYLDAKFTALAINERITFALESTGVPQLTAPQIGKYLVAAPRLIEQRAISQALSDVDALITTLDRLIAKKRDLKQGTMQQLLTGKTRLAGFLSPWIKKSFGDISEYVDGEITAGGDEGYVEIGDIDVENKTYNVSQKTKLSVPGAVKVPTGTLLISTVRPTRGAITVTSSAVHVSSAFCR